MTKHQPITPLRARALQRLTAIDDLEDAALYLDEARRLAFEWMEQSGIMALAMPPARGGGHASGGHANDLPDDDKIPF